MRLDDWKLLAYRSGVVKLYSVSHDIQEKNDLAETHPQKAKELLIRLIKWEQEMGVERFSGVQ